MSFSLKIEKKEVYLRSLFLEILFVKITFQKHIFCYGK